MNTSNAVISLPAIVGESIYFSSVLEVGSNRNCSDHVVVFVMKPPRAEAHNESSAPPFGDRKRRRHRIADVSDDIDCLLSSTRFPSAYAVSPAVRIPGNKPYDYFDIIRCEVPDIISKGLPHNEKTLLVHLVSGKRGSLIQFILSVDTRSTGHMSTAFTSGPFTKRQPRGKNSSFFLLVPCVTDVFGVKLAVRIIEFLQHHISIGVSHVVMGFPFERQSRAMDLLMQYLLSFVKSGHLTIVPLIDTTNTVSKLSRTVGVLKYRSVSNLLFNNMCLYLTKGVADHIGIWDINSFLIPKAPITPGLSAFIKENSFHDGSSVNGDGSAHPNCQLSLSTRLLFDGRKSAPGEYTWWLGQRYGEEIIQHHRSSLLPGRPILATEVIYRVGLSGSAEACLLPREWTRCSQDQTGESPFLAKSSNKASHFCIDQPMRPSRRRARLSNLNKENEHHDFDSAVTYKDIHSVSPSMGYLMRFITNPPGPDRLSAVVPNEYRSHFYGVVLGALQDRGLDKVFLLPVDSVEMEVVAKSADRLWAPFVHNSERHAGGFLPSGQLAIPGVDKRSASAEKEKEETAGKCVCCVCVLVIRTDFCVSELVDGVTELPQYAKDNSEFFYGAIIERKSDSLDLHLTVFLVCPSMARTTHHVEALENTQKQKWKEYLLTNRRPQYELSGIRKQRYYCRIRNSEDLSAEQYLIPAHFMPNRLTPDSNANSNVDIMRCPMKNAADAYSRFAHTGHSVVVEILRDQDKNSLISFAVPWASRQTGYMLQSPSFATQLDPWLGADELLGTKETIPADLQYGKDRQAQRGGTSGRHDLYMCVPGMESPFDRRMLPLYMEFLEHHFQLGVKHIFLAATYTWGGENMKNLLGTVRSYIEDGMVSVVSNAVGVGASDCTYSFNGIALARDTVKVIFTNMCLYRAKGMADYVGIWVKFYNLSVLTGW